MSDCIVIQSKITPTGSDVTPSAIAFGNIIGFLGTGSTNTVTISGIDTPITIRSAWTTGGGETIGYWVKNGANQLDSLSPVEISVNNGDTLQFKLYLTNSPDSSSGEITFTNQSDGGVNLDTASYYIEDMSGGFPL